MTHRLPERSPHSRSELGEETGGRRISVKRRRRWGVEGRGRRMEAAAPRLSIKAVPPTRCPPRRSSPPGATPQMDITATASSLPPGAAPPPAPAAFLSARRRASPGHGGFPPRVTHLLPKPPLPHSLSLR
ncbi:hypothetical protein BS78_06G182900 [Paspalum vaginatum]|nr:hypothetical protein BS78_06G182900 [Paspalum vaginatum]